MGTCRGSYRNIFEFQNKKKFGWDSQTIHTRSACIETPSAPCTWNSKPLPDTSVMHARSGHASREDAIQGHRPLGPIHQNQNQCPSRCWAPEHVGCRPRGAARSPPGAAAAHAIDRANRLTSNRRHNVFLRRIQSKVDSPHRPHIWCPAKRTLVSRGCDSDKKQVPSQRPAGLCIDLAMVMLFASCSSLKALS